MPISRRKDLKSTLRLPRSKARGMLRVDTERHPTSYHKGRGLGVVEVSKITFSLGIITSLFLVLFLTNAVGFFVPLKSLAVSLDVGYGATFGLGTSNLLDVVINIVQWVLGLLGLIAVIIILYGGFVWMTAAGNEVKIKKAKQILTNAVIGLAIILLAWAIVLFVMGVITNAGGGGGGSYCFGTTNCDPLNCCYNSYCAQNCGGGLPGSEFNVAEVEVSRDPYGNVYQCSMVKTKFNATVNSQSVIDATAPNILNPLATTSSGNAFAGNFSTLGNAITFEHPNTLFTINTDYQEEYPKTDTPIKDNSTPQRSLYGCQVGLVGCDPTPPNQVIWGFHVGDQNDTTPPEIIESTYPEISTVVPPAVYPNQNVSRAPTISVIFSEPIYDQSIIVPGNPLRPNNNFKLEKLDGQGGSVVSTFDNNLLIADNSVTNGFNVYIEDPLLNPLDAFTWYRLTVQNVQDLCSNVMTPNPTFWEFETNDTMPGVFSWSPTGTNECPDVNVYITFGTSMYYNEVGIVISKQGGGDTRQVTMTPETLSPGPYEIVVPGQGTFKVMNYFKTFSFEPNPDWSSNSTYDVNVDTDLVINQSGQTLSQDWTFGVSTADACTCAPYAWGINPSEGPKESCVTVQGDCFTGTQANPIIPSGPTIKFDNTPATVGGYDADYITTTIPGNFNFGESPNAFVTITYQNPSFGTLTSSPPGPEFYVNSNNVSDGPCLWSINPTAGMANWGFHCDGIRFGTPQPSELGVNYLVNFSGGAHPSQYSSWTDEDIQTVVPTNAQDGNVTVTNPQGTSNGIYFDMQVPPPGTPYFVVDTSCVVSPASPTPYDNEQNACLNALISGRFNPNVLQGQPNAMNRNTMNSSTIHISKCDDGAACGALTQVNGSWYYMSVNATDDTFKFDPTDNLLPDTYYKVEITTGVQNSQGIGLFASYDWIFKTQVQTSDCQVESIGVTPNSATVGYNGQQTFYATPYGPSCQMLGGNYNWEWTSTNTNIATVVPDPSDPSEGDASATNQSSGSSWIQARITGQNPMGQGLLNVDLTYCQDNPNICNQQCPGSQCVNGHCTPVITGLSGLNNQPSGPVGQYVTVSGCMFGGYNSYSLVKFLGPPIVEAKWPEACGPDGNTWNDTTIEVEVPEDETASPLDDADDGAVQVITQWGNDDTNADPGYNGDFTVTGGVAVNLCPLVPSSGPNGQDFTATGEGFGIYIYQSSNVWFTGALGPVNAALYTSWSNTIITDYVPSNAITGNVYVQSGLGNQSNQVPFTVSCTNNSQCITICCFANECKPIAYCSGGNPGDLCQIPTNPNCPSGPLSFPQSYDCISTTGDIESTSPPPPEPPAFGNDCRICCEPLNVYNNLTCIANRGSCTGPERGLYCGCDDDPDCGSPQTIGCGDYGQPERCCYGRPSVLPPTSPAPGQSGVCINAAIVITFDTLMNHSTFTYSNIVVSIGGYGGDPLVGNITSYDEGGHTVAVFEPNFNFQANTTFYVTVMGDPNLYNGSPQGVLSNHQVGMNDVGINHSHQFLFTTGNDLCQIDHVVVDIYKIGGNGNMQVLQNQNSDLYLCANETGCSDDYNLIMPGNQHVYTAHAEDANNVTLSNITYTWSESMPGAGVLAQSGGGIPQTQRWVTPTGPDGQENIIVNANGGPAGTGSAVIDGRVDACNNPWPQFEPFVNPPPGYTPFLYPTGLCQGPTCLPEDPTHFTTRYCRDAGDPGPVGDLPYITYSNVTQNPSIYPYIFTPTNPDVDELLREIFLTPSGSEDVIGLRVMENHLHVSPQAWFNNMFPESAGSGGATMTVDGYPAIKVGRTTYVAATNFNTASCGPTIDCVSPGITCCGFGTCCSNGIIYNDIYLISYNDTASESTINIANQLVENWYFNTNLPSSPVYCVGDYTNKQCLVRDNKRTTDLGEIADALDAYKVENNQYPALSAGTFLPGLTTSKWPSWNAVLGNEIGLSPAVDPNNFWAPPGEASCDNSTFCPNCDPNTCWDEVGKKYFCPNNLPGFAQGVSHAYIYQYRRTGSAPPYVANLYANLEYTGPGSGRNTTGILNFCPNPPYADSNCACFDYWIESTSGYQGNGGYLF